MTYMFRSIIICLIAFSSIAAHAQKGWELGGWIGASNYFGDLNTNFRINDPGSFKFKPIKFCKN